MGIVLVLFASFFVCATVTILFLATTRLDPRDDDYDLYAFPLEPADYDAMTPRELLRWRNGNRKKLGMQLLH